MIENGEVALDLPIDLQRPRERGSAAALERAILRHLFRNARRGEDAGTDAHRVGPLTVGIVRASTTG